MTKMVVIIVLNCWLATMLCHPPLSEAFRRRGTVINRAGSHKRDISLLKKTTNGRKVSRRRFAITSREGEEAIAMPIPSLRHSEMSTSNRRHARGGSKGTTATCGKGTAPRGMQGKDARQRAHGGLIDGVRDLPTDAMEQMGSEGLVQILRAQISPAEMQGERQRVEPRRAGRSSIPSGAAREAGRGGADSAPRAGPPQTPSRLPLGSRTRRAPQWMPQRRGAKEAEGAKARSARARSMEGLTVKKDRLDAANLQPG
ncbi:unnamed protein product [Prorocentrum cordatum]|uniref:Uncharacterized protein n=1 Tax=Prorocentrum cordatum TaxID=2364126 RepID=A0ABN9WMB9_9DINO|nr:unnamed protein product [Polarella glacialis]